MNWETIKEIFYTIGAIAGIIAISRPIFEEKFNKDRNLTKRILESIDEQKMIDLEQYIWSSRSVPDSLFETLHLLILDLKNNSSRVRFSGLLSSHLRKALEGIVSEYSRLRELIQVDEWEPTYVNGEMMWVFNKQAFAKVDGIPKKYVEHLEECVDRARLLLRAYQRFQIIAEVHFFESPFAQWLLPRRFKKNQLYDG